MDMMELIHEVKKNSQITIVGKGNKSKRPTENLYVGKLYIDDELATNGKPIWWNGFNWIDANGKIV